jgi:hypothetical protein
VQSSCASNNVPAAIPSTGQSCAVQAKPNHKPTHAECAFHERGPRAEERQESPLAWWPKDERRKPSPRFLGTSRSTELGRNGAKISFLLGVVTNASGSCISPTPRGSGLGSGLVRRGPLVLNQYVREIAHAFDRQQPHGSFESNPTARPWPPFSEILNSHNHRITAQPGIYSQGLTRTGPRGAEW